MEEKYTKLLNEFFPKRLPAANQKLASYIHHHIESIKISEEEKKAFGKGCYNALWHYWISFTLKIIFNLYQSDPIKALRILYYILDDAFEIFNSSSHITLLFLHTTIYEDYTVEGGKELAEEGEKGEFYAFDINCPDMDAKIESKDQSYTFFSQDYEFDAEDSDFTELSFLFEVIYVLPAIYVLSAED